MGDLDGLVVGGIAMSRAVPRFVKDRNLLRCLPLRACEIEVPAKDASLSELPLASVRVICEAPHGRDNPWQWEEERDITIRETSFEPIRRVGSETGLELAAVAASIPAIPKISLWVIHQLQAVSSFLGISFDGVEKQVIELFTTLEREMISIFGSDMDNRRQIKAAPVEDVGTYNGQISEALLFSGFLWVAIVLP